MMSKCTESEVGSLLHAYEIGALSDSDQEKFETHLLSCEHCFNAVQDFDSVASVLRTDEDVESLARGAAADSAPESGGLVEKLWRYLWPEGPLLLKPALAYLLVLALLIPAYRGFQGKPGPDETILPVQIISCFPVRDAEQEVFSRSTGDNGIISFYLLGAIPGEPYQVTITSADGKVIFQDDVFNRFDEHGTGWLMLSLKAMPPGIYHLSVSNSDANTPTSQNYDFVIID